jgi:DNA repair exonuclease SbcCD ATPase subunit
VDACTGGVNGKLDELRELHARIGDLCNSAKELLQGFGNEDARFRAEFKTQIESLERFKGEMAIISALRDRLKVEQEKVEDYERRIDKVQAKIEKQKEMEVGKKRVSCESSILEGPGKSSAL